MVHGYPNTGSGYAGVVLNNSRFGIPSLLLQDGPQGVADGAADVTCWPSALTMAASWDVANLFDWGRAMAEEQFAKGANVMLGPGVNLARVPWGGRTFEYMGEDPMLAYALVRSEVEGIQSLPVLGCVKHFVHNEQEASRGDVSANVGARVSRELYYPPFAGAVDGGVGSVMCAYNRVNGSYACQNEAALAALKGNATAGGLGFRGFVVSDWGATHDMLPSALGGLDMQMPDVSGVGWARLSSIWTSISVSITPHLFSHSPLTLTLHFPRPTVSDLPSPPLWPTAPCRSPASTTWWSACWYRCWLRARPVGPACSISAQRGAI